MVALSFSEVFKLLIKYHDGKVDNVTYVSEFLHSFFEDDEVRVDEIFVSRILNGARDITKEVLNPLSEKSGRKYCEDYIKDAILPEVDPDTVNDLISDLSALVSNDPTIPEAKKDEILKEANLDTLLSFLKKIIFYSLKRKNKKAVEKPSKDDALLLQEVNFRCPLCKEKLTKGKNYFFTIVPIFPIGLSEEKELEFSKVHEKPKDLNDLSNMICLCDSCATEYLFNPDIKTFNSLYRFKKMNSAQADIMDSILDYKLEEEITEILDKIKNPSLSKAKLAELRMIPLKVTDKIKEDNIPLANSINNDNTSYYYFIRDYLSNEDIYKVSFKQIACEFRTVYLELSKKDLDQETIYNSIVEWVLKSSSLPIKYNSAARVIVSFFVQNCEVFEANEIPE